MANGVPVVQPRRGVSRGDRRDRRRDHRRRDNPEALADGWLELWRDPARAPLAPPVPRACARTTVDRMAEAAEVYRELQSIVV